MVVSLVWIFLIPLASTISVLSLTAATAEDPSAQVLGAPSVHFGGLLSAHFGGVPEVVVLPVHTVGAALLAHVGVFPSLHSFGPISLVVFDSVLTVAFPSAHVDGGPPAVHAGLFPSEQLAGCFE